MRSSRVIQDITVRRGAAGGSVIAGHIIIFRILPASPAVSCRQKVAQTRVFVSSAAAASSRWRATAKGVNVCASAQRPDSMAPAPAAGDAQLKLRRLREACTRLRAPVNAVSEEALRDVAAALGASERAPTS